MKKRNIEDIELDREEMRLQIDKANLECIKIDNEIKKVQLKRLTAQALIKKEKK